MPKPPSNKYKSRERIERIVYRSGKSAAAVLERIKKQPGLNSAFVRALNNPADNDCYPK
jgi:hypothetical protein